MRSAGVRGLLIYCSDFRCSYWTAISGNRWPDEVRLSDIEPLFVRRGCGQASLRAPPYLVRCKTFRGRNLTIDRFPLIWNSNSRQCEGNLDEFEIDHTNSNNCKPRSIGEL
jgi:hypothetical protein